MKAIRPLTLDDAPRLKELITGKWGSTRMVSRGRVVDILAQRGFVALTEGTWVGYAAYEVREREMEITVLDTITPGTGAGSALLATCGKVALDGGLERLMLVTTNDNTAALRFYQRRGFVLAALRTGAIDEARRTLKPEIAKFGLDEIPIRDELELELPRDVWPGIVERYRWPSI